MARLRQRFCIHTYSVAQSLNAYQAQPPVCVGQPFPALVQHQAFLATDQPLAQLANPASQSNGAEVVPTGWHPPSLHPLPWCAQHQDFFSTDQPACQFAKPAAQSNGSAGGGGEVGVPSQML